MTGLSGQLFGLSYHSDRRVSRHSSVRDWNKQFATAGPNPFEHLAYRIVNDRVYWHELNNGVWVNYDKLPSIALSEVAYDLKGELYHTFACRFAVKPG